MPVVQRKAGVRRMRWIALKAGVGWVMGVGSLLPDGGGDPLKGHGVNAAHYLISAAVGVHGDVEL